MQFLCVMFKDLKAIYRYLRLIHKLLFFLVNFYQTNDGIFKGILQNSVRGTHAYTVNHDSSCQTQLMINLYLFITR